MQEFRRLFTAISLLKVKTKHAYSNVYFNHFDAHDKLILKFLCKISIVMAMGVVKVHKILEIFNSPVH